MFHFGKTPEGELDIRVDGNDVGALYRAVSSASLPDRGPLHDLKKYIEENFSKEIYGRPIIEPSEVRVF